MNDNFFIIVIAIIGILSIVIFLSASRKSDLKNNKSSLLSNVISFKRAQQDKKITYEDVRKSGDSLSSLMALIA